MAHVYVVYNDTAHILHRQDVRKPQISNPSKLFSPSWAKRT
jgi:hypothetical protein